MEAGKEVMKASGNLIGWGVGILVAGVTVYALSYFAYKGWNRAERSSIEKGTAV